MGLCSASSRTHSAVGWSGSGGAHGWRSGQLLLLAVAASGRGTTRVGGGGRAVIALCNLAGAYGGCERARTEVFAD